MARIQLPYPHKGQQIVRSQARRFNWLAAGRRWRKTTMAMSIAVESAAKGRRIIWGAPVFDQVRVGWEETERAAHGVASFNASRMVASFPNGGAIIYRSLDNPDNARGHTADGVVIDECADVIAEAWYEVLRPMLIDTNGWAWGIGSPKGRNWFWTEHHKVAAGDTLDTMAWSAPTLGCRITSEGLVREPHGLENPNIPFSEIVSLHETMPERAFQQEVMSLFLEEFGGVFRGVRACVTDEVYVPQAGTPYVIGADWGRSEDYTVFVVIDTAQKRVVQVDRSNQVDYAVQRGRLRALWERYGQCAVVAEANSMGQPIIEQLSREGLRIRAFMTTNASKAAVIEDLALAFERKQITLPPHQVLIDELEAFESTRLPSGLIRYTAPAGMHDDAVMALAIGWSMVGRSSSAVGAFG